MVNDKYTQSKILYLNDETRNLKVFEINFSNDFHLLLARNKMDALKILNENEIKVFITDHYMSDVLGLELVKEVKDLYPDLLCVIFTAYPDNDVLMQAINDVDVFRFIVKPWREFDVIQTIKKAIEFYDSQLEKKKLLSELTVALKKAEEGSHLRSLILSNIPHEIRTPLNGIVGLCGLVSKRIQNDSNLSNINDGIQQCCDQLIMVIEDLLITADLVSRENNVVESDFSVNDFFRSINDRFNGQALAKDLDISIAGITKHEDILIKADKIKLFEVFIQLLRNAIKFTSSGSVEFGLLDDRKCLFYVRDTGIGIDNRNKEKIFNIFWKNANDITAQSYRGIGVGLSIVSEYISRVNGKIWVESELNKGSSFYFTFPYKKCEEVLKNNQKKILKPLQGNSKAHNL